MARPSDLPTQEKYVHGSRARYVTGCRCSPCRAANVRAYHQRQARAREAAEQLGPAPAIAAPQVWTAPDGSKRTRLYARACPGINGQPCPARSHLRKDSGPVCARCRDRLVWNGLVSAEAARTHLLWLSRRGVGRRAVAAASDVSPTILMEIRNGTKRQLRADTERRILAVDRDCVSDHALVSASRAWRQLRRLIADGYPARRLVRFLGMKGQGLQFGRVKMTARNVRRIDRLYRELLAVA